MKRLWDVRSEDGSGRQLSGVVQWSARGVELPKRVAPGRRHEGGGLCPKLDPSRNLKPEHLPRPPSLWQGDTESPDTAI